MSNEVIARLAAANPVRSDRPIQPPAPLRVPTRRLAFAAAALAVAVAVPAAVALTLSAAAPESAYAAAKKAIAASAPGALDSGTMTVSRSPDGSTWSVDVSARWNGKDVAIESEGGMAMVPGFEQLLLVAGGVYLQRTDGSWLHYPSEADLGPPLDIGTVQAIFGLVAGTRAAQIIASTYGLDKTVQSDGSTVYRGTVPPTDPAEVAPSGDKTGQVFLPGFGPGGALQLVVGADGLVRQMSETASPPAAGAWRIEYSQLGTSASITPPASYTEGTPGDLPTPPQQVPRDTPPHPVP